MKRDYKEVVRVGEMNVYTDTYKAFKKDIDEKSIAELEKSIANLTKIEKEYREKMEALKSKEVIV